MAIFDSIKSAIVGVKNQVDRLDQQISELQLERAELVSLPLPYEDFCDWVSGRYDHLAEQGSGLWKREFLGNDSSLRGFYMSTLSGHETLSDFNAVYGRFCPLSFEKPSSFNIHFPMTDGVFFSVFKNVIKDGIRRMLDEKIRPEWPKKVGLSRAERIPKIEALERKLNALIAQRNDFKSGLANAVGDA